MAKSVVRVQSARRRDVRRSTESDTEREVQGRRARHISFASERSTADTPLSPEAVGSRSSTVDSEMQTIDEVDAEIDNELDIPLPVSVPEPSNPSEFETENHSRSNASSILDSPTYSSTPTPSEVFEQAVVNSDETDNGSMTVRSTSPQFSHMTPERCESVQSAHNTSECISPGEELHSVSSTNREAIGSAIDEDEHESSQTSGDDDEAGEEDEEEVGQQSEEGREQGEQRQEEDNRACSETSNDEDEVEEDDGEEQQMQHGEETDVEQQSEEEEMEVEQEEEDGNVESEEEQSIDEEPQDENGRQEDNQQSADAGISCYIIHGPT